LYKDGDEMDEDVEQVAVILTDAAEQLLPHVQPIARWKRK